MSILSKNNNTMSTPIFHEFKKQASFFFKEKIKTARLALTDVTPAELMTEEATNGNSWAPPDARTLGTISKAAFELDDYSRIIHILHKRLEKFEKKNWRVSYNSMLVLEHLLTHGPESVAEEFMTHKDEISHMESFQFIDEKGFNWGLAVRKKSERVLKLLEKGPLLKEERNRARKVTREIQGFGSFCQRSSSGQVSVFERCNSDFTDHHDYHQENQILEDNLFHKKDQRSEQMLKACIITENPKSSSGLDDRSVTSFKENMGLDEKEDVAERNPLLGENVIDLRRNGKLVEDDHPFAENVAVASLL